MKFKNTRNGTVLDLPENFSGKYWEPVEKPVPKTVRKKKPAVKTPAKK